MISERLKIAMQAAGISQAELARRCNVKPPSVNGWLNGKAKFLRGENLLAAARALNVSQHWLATGQGKMRETDANVSLSTIGDRKIPLINYVQAGKLTEVADINDIDADNWIPTDLELSRNAFALEIKGDSMLPEFNEGDRIIIDPDVAPRPGDYVVAKNHKEEATFKKYRLKGMDSNGNHIFELIPLNEDYPTLRSNMIPLRIIGTMIEHRKYRKR